VVLELHAVRRRRRYAWIRFRDGDQSYGKGCELSCPRCPQSLFSLALQQFDHREKTMDHATRTKPVAADGMNMRESARAVTYVAGIARGEKGDHALVRIAEAPSA